MSVPLLEGVLTIGRLLPRSTRRSIEAWCLQRDIDVGTHRDLRALKTFGGDAYDSSEMPVKINRLAQDACIAAELFSPAGVVEQRHRLAGIIRQKSAAPRGRSEERRVGKECRSRWSP